MNKWILGFPLLLTACAASPDDIAEGELPLRSRSQALTALDKGDDDSADELDEDSDVLSRQSDTGATDGGSCYVDGPNVPDRFKYRKGTYWGGTCCFPKDEEWNECIACDASTECQTGGGDVGVRVAPGDELTGLAVDAAPSRPPSVQLDEGSFDTLEAQDFADLAAKTACSGKLGCAYAACYDSCMETRINGSYCQYQCNCIVYDRQDRMTCADSNPYIDIRETPPPPPKPLTETTNPDKLN